MNVLMVGVDKNRIGGMWTVAETFINSEEYNRKVHLHYIATSTCGSKVKRTIVMLKGYCQIMLCLMTNNIDIVHIHMAERGSSFRKEVVVRLGKLYHKKVIIQLHAGPFMKWYSEISEANQERIRNIFDNADCVLALGEYWKKQLETIVNAEKLKVLYNGSYCPKVNPYNSHGNLILYLGLLKRTKGIYDLIDAIELVNDKLDSSIQIYLCGTDEEGDIQDVIDNRKLNDRIKLLGWIKKEKKLELFENAQMCVLPSYFEALSMTVIESMCYGIPMVTTDISTMSELLGDEVEKVRPGDWKSLGELILKWSLDEPMRTNMSKKLYERAGDCFSISQNIQDTLNIYSNVLRME